MKWISRKPKVTPNEDDLIIDKIAKIRGIKDTNRFLNPTQDEMFDPYLIKNIEEASKRLIRAINMDEQVLFSYDADADGLTSTSMMIRQLMTYTDNVDYIYNERNHGHGIHEQTKLNFVTSEDMDENGVIKDEYKRSRYELNLENLEKIKKSDLLVIVDSSSNDTEACEMLMREYGVDILIIDHHAIEKENPNVLLVNPQQDGDEYPNKFLSGAGVAFKVVQVMEEMLGEHSKVDPFDYMDLVAVGMYADIMRIDVYENRYMIMHGLRNIKNVGIKRILKGAKADLYKLNGDSIGFSIAPMMNGVARLDNIKLGIDILLTDDDNVAKKLRLQMHKLNEKRKVMQKEIVERYMGQVNTSEKVLMVMDEDSSKGFNGLVSQQLAQKFKRPALVGRLHKGKFSGSFRSYGGFNLKKFLNESGLVEESMGHNQAGGFTIKEENIEELLTYVDWNLPNLSETEENVVYDIEINADEINNEVIKAFEQFNLVTGNGFPKIITRVNGILIEKVETIGKTAETRKFKTFDELELIKFKVNGAYGAEIDMFDSIDALGKLHMNEFYNFAVKKKISTPQIMLEGYRKS